MIRTLRPTDIVACLAFYKRTRQHNAALQFPGDNPSTMSFGSFFGRSLSLDPRRETWIAVQGGHIEGFVGIKTRLGTDVWDIDQLIAFPTDAESVYIELLRHLSRSAVEEGIQKIFLRSCVEDPPTWAARRASFTQYAVERIYRLSAVPSSLATCEIRLGECEGPRPRRGADHHDIFQLYCSVVPANVRQVEGMTMQEWRWTEGWGLRPSTWKVSLPRTRRDYVLVREGALIAWLQVRPRARYLILTLNAAGLDAAEDFVRFGVAQIGEGGPIYMPVRQYQHFVEPTLQRLGFDLVSEHALLAKTLAVRVSETKVVPLRAHAPN